MSIKAGELAVLKTSREVVYVLETTETEAVVRRPVMTENGIVHMTEPFSLGELETQEDSQKRDIAERKNMRDLLFGSESKDEVAGQDTPFNKFN